MSTKLDHSNADVNLYDDVSNIYKSVEDIVDDSLIKKVWCDLDRQVPLDRVSCVVFEVALGFEKAVVKTFLPILVHRLALERLRQELNETDPTNSHLLID